MSKTRAHVIISGKVQCVYYRVETRDQAVILGVTGWVRNMPDRTVEGVLKVKEQMSKN